MAEAVVSGEGEREKPACQIEMISMSTIQLYRIWMQKYQRRRIWGFMLWKG